MKFLLVIPFLAAAESTYQGVASSRIGETLVQIAALSVIAVAILNLVDRLRGGAPQKREVSFAQEFATKEELKQAQAANDKELREAHGRMNRERKELDAKIDDLKEQADRLSEKLDTKIDELQERIDHVPNRTISMLRETKGLLG